MITFEFIRVILIGVFYIMGAASLLFDVGCENNELEPSKFFQFIENKVEVINYLRFNIFIIMGFIIGLIVVIHIYPFYTIGRIIKWMFLSTLTL